MKVRDLINELEKVEDKDLEVAIHAGARFDAIRKVSRKEVEYLEKKAVENSKKLVIFLHRGELNGS